MKLKMGIALTSVVLMGLAGSASAQWRHDQGNHRGWNIGRGNPHREWEWRNHRAQELRARIARDRARAFRERERAARERARLARIRWERSHHH